MLTAPHGTETRGIVRGIPQTSDYDADIDILQLCRNGSDYIRRNCNGRPVP